MNRRRRGNESLIKQKAKFSEKDQRLVTSSPTGFMVLNRAGEGAVQGIQARSSFGEFSR